jgi:peptidoglycan/xylan/chitin deacetylase (PgdA/CDA1 family)
MHKPQSSRRRPVLFVRLSVAVHVLCLAAVIIAPELWRWLLAIALANHALIALIGLWPRSRWLGPNWTALPPAAAARNEIALTIDDGPDPAITPQVLDLLARHRIKATFFCVGRKAQQYPELCREIVRRGHAVENHSQRHWHNFSLLGPSGYMREIEAAQNTFSEITGQRPQFFRAPAGLRNPFLEPVLARLNLKLASWSVRGFDTRVGDAAKVTKRLLRGMRPGAILLLHDGNAAQTESGIPVIVAVLPAVIEYATAQNLHFVTLREAAYEHNSVACDI